MEMRYPAHAEAVRQYTTDQLRAEFLIPEIFTPDSINLVYTHADRVIIGGVCPTSSLALTADRKTIGTDYFLERREIGIINVGGPGCIRANGSDHEIHKYDGLYIGRGTEKVVFESLDAENPARFYFNSAPAHATYPTAEIKISTAEPAHLGADSNSNRRTIYKYIHPDGVKSCQLVMGLTQLAPNNMWNTMPAHLHSRRMETYFYFDITGENVVFHFMGEPDETRHFVIRNEQVVISPSWSIHSGVGTGNYTFIWCMAGENQSFADMDPVPMNNLR
jgi:4-deoxy-L-threo-5-hexosulose-uronate ketol-isomerase